MIFKMDNLAVYAEISPCACYKVVAKDTLVLIAAMHHHAPKKQQ